MKVSDISRVKVDWMEQYRNDPSLKFILKDGRDITPADQFRYRQYGDLFYAEHEGEVRYLAHNRSDHNGFGGSPYELHMADDWNASQWRDCARTEPLWGSGGRYMDVRCTLKGRTLHLKGPWSSSAAAVSRKVSPVVDVAVLTPQYNNMLRNPKYYESMRKKGRAWEGTYLAYSFTLDFVREVVDALAPHLELYEGDFGWYPVVKGDQPKNPRKGIEIGRNTDLSGEQLQAFCI